MVPPRSLVQAQPYLSPRTSRGPYIYLLPAEGMPWKLKVLGAFHALV